MVARRLNLLGPFGIDRQGITWRRRSPRYAAVLDVSRCSQSCTRLSSQTVTLNRIHAERSRCGRKTAPGASMMPSRCDASASGSESSMCGNLRPDEHAVRRLHEQFQSDAFEGADDIEARLS